MSPKSILFVCTGNVFRSVSAEQSFKKYLIDNGITDWNVGSAGIIAHPEPIDAKILETLRDLGIDNVEHKQRRLTREILDQYDVIVGMAENHIEFIESEFNYKYAILFNELALRKHTSVWDIEDEIADPGHNRPAVEAKLERTVKEIFGKIPEVFRSANERFYLFSDFVGGKITHRNGYPFTTLDETANSIAFMSLDIPFKEDGHVLVIPKKRYFNFSDIPNEILNEMLGSIKKIGQALNIDHSGYNILLNNGLDAGQYIIHTHFHIIPRRSDDGIELESWKRPGVTREEFIAFNEKLKRQIEKSS
jgi:protein-tyrosine-phosphatase